jgi:hypothetical protein
VVSKVAVADVAAVARTVRIVVLLSVEEVIDGCAAAPYSPLTAAVQFSKKQPLVTLTSVLDPMQL